ncbi:MAG: tetratricopeptide repeat protein [Gammaproteobacteria bacterium]|nr:tetratricopeptide repeat protein [Gammaproteobacteria bacterium]
MDKHAIFLPAARQIKRILLASLFLIVAGCAGTGQERAPENEAPGDDAAMHIATAERLADVGEYESALQEYLAAARASDDPEIARMVTRLAGRLQNWQVAAEAALRWLELDPEAATAHQLRIVALVNEGRQEAAVEAVAGWLAADGRDLADIEWRRAAALLAAASERESARSVFDRLVERAGEDAPRDDVAHAESILLWQHGETAPARERARDAVEAGGEVEHLVWAAQLAAEDEDLDSALTLYRRARADRPDDVGLALSEAEVLRQLERDEEAISVLRALEPDVDALYTLGIYLVQLDRSEEAEETWHRLVEVVDGDEPEQAFLAAQLAELAGRDDDALEWYARVTSGPRLEQALLRRSVILGRSQRVDEARDLLERLRADTGPEMQQETWLIEAEMLRSTGRADEAVALLAEPLADNPGSMDLLYARALSAATAGEIDLAEQDLRRLIQMDPENAMALNALGYTLADQTDRYQEAYRLIERALELDPEDPATLDSMGWVLYRLGRAEEAVEYLERALAGEENPEIMAHLVEVLHHLGRGEEAGDLAARGLEQYPESPYMLDTLERLDLEP